MTEKSLHIDRAVDLYIKLSECRSKFIFNGVRKYLLLSELDKNKEKYIAFCYIYQELINKNGTTKKINLPRVYAGLNFEYRQARLSFSCGNCVLSYSISELNTKSEITIAIDLLDSIKGAERVGNNTTSVEIEENTLPLYIGDDGNENDFGDVVCYLLVLVKKRQKEDDFSEWFRLGIRNLGYKIFNEFTFSYTTAEYLRDDVFSKKLEKVQKAFSKARNDHKWYLEERDSGNFAPLLMKSVMKMAACYQLFCRQVESQTSRIPDELYFGLRTDIDAELRSIFPYWDTLSFELDGSDILTRLFGAFMDIGFIDHRFILDQQNVEKLVFAIDTIDSCRVEGGLEIDSWELSPGETKDLLSDLNQHGNHIRTTKLLLKLVRAKACTLICKINNFLENLLSEDHIPRIKIIRRAGIMTLNDFARTCRPVLDYIRNSDSSGNYVFNNENNTDLERYNLRACHIHKNAVWFSECGKKYGSDFSKMKAADVLKIYEKYGESKESEITGSKKLIVFSDLFLEKALEVMGDRLQEEIDKIEQYRHNSNTQSQLRDAYVLLKDYRKLIEEFRKLAEYSERFGYMKDQDLFENSFYCPGDGKLGVGYKQREVGGDDINDAIKDNWIFMASTHYAPSYPNHFKRLYEQYEERRRNFSTRLYAAIPTFLNKDATAEIEKSFRSERRETIQLLAIFSALIAFVTASVGAFKDLDTGEYGVMVVIFVMAMAVFAITLRVLLVKSGKWLQTGLLVIMILILLFFYFTSFWIFLINTLNGVIV